MTKEDDEEWKREPPVSTARLLPSIGAWQTDLPENLIRTMFADARVHTENNDDGTYTHTMLWRTKDYDILDANEIE